VVILLGPFDFIAHKHYLNYSILSVPDKGYSRNMLCILNLISTFSLLTF
jgi:hypothetical protein